MHASFVCQYPAAEITSFATATALSFFSPLLTACPACPGSMIASHNPAGWAMICQKCSRMLALQSCGRRHTMALQASNLALPCREMCEAVVSTCSCNKQRKFGPLLEKVNEAISAGGSGLVSPPHSCPPSAVPCVTPAFSCLDAGKIT